MIRSVSELDIQNVMHSHSNTTRLSLMAALLTAGAINASAPAALIYVNSSQATIGTSTGSAGSARYHLNHGNYDQNIFNGVGSLASNNIITSNLGNVNRLSNRTFSFTLENRAGEGLVFNLSSPVFGSSPAINSTLAWGTFGTTITGQAPTINGVAPGAEFNVISLRASANRNNTSMAFDNLSFTSAGITVADGSLYSGISSRNGSGVNTGSLTSPGAPVISPFSDFTQFIASQSNLNTFNWTLSGSITGIRDANGSGSAAVAFEVGLSKAAVTIAGGGGGGGGGQIPEPSAAALLMLFGAPLLMRRR